MTGSRNKKHGSNEDPFGELRLGFDGLLSALGEAISDISGRLETGQAGEVRRSFEVDTGKGPVRAEAGVRVRFADAGGAGRSSIKSDMSQPINPDRLSQPVPTREPAQSRPRAMDLEVIQDTEVWRLTADIPGVEPSELVLREESGELIIETTGTRRFHGATPLPDGLDVEAIDVSLRNGILELTGKLDGAART